jgi:hypothetical protein
MDKPRALELQAITRQRFAREKILVQTISLVAVLVSGIGIQSFAENSSNVTLGTANVNRTVKQDELGISGILMPGGRIQFANGVVIQAPVGDPAQPVILHVQTLPISSISIANSYGLEPVSIFEIGSAKSISSKKDTFSIALPIPQKYIGKPVYTFMLLPAGVQTDSSLDGDQWFLYEGDTSEDGSQISFYTDVLFNGMTVGIFVEKQNL